EAAAAETPDANAPPATTASPAPMPPSPPGVVPTTPPRRPRQDEVVGQASGGPDSQPPKPRGEREAATPRTRTAHRTDWYAPAPSFSGVGSWFRTLSAPAAAWG